MKYACLIAHCRRGYIHPASGFKDFYPWEFGDERNSHSAVWWKIFEALDNTEASKVAMEAHATMQTLFHKYNPRSGSYFKSWAMVLHNIDEDTSLVGDWIPDCSKYDPSYLFDKTKCSNDILQEYNII